MKLVIVESPNKVKTIKKYLGSEFDVTASVGHIIDLASEGKYNMGVNEDNGLFTPNYQIVPTKKKTVEKLIKLKEQASEVFLATDPDREGEAIAMHLCSALNIDPNLANRLEFHEITKHAILDAFQNVRHIDLDLFYAQETRRIMDRLIGYKTSYIVQRDAYVSSAGRVQSVVLGFVYDRTKEIEEFVPSPYYYLTSKLDKDTILYFSKDGKEKYRFDSETEVKDIFNKLTNFQVLKDIEINKKETKSLPPLILSTLQQTCSYLYKYKINSTLDAAKELFEDGYITYPRTDSIRLAPEFINKAKDYILNNYGSEYVGVAKKSSGNGNIQDAHEALRPTDLKIGKEEILEIYTKKFGKEKYAKSKIDRIANVYNLIFKRTLQSMMSPKIDEISTYKFDNNGNLFILNNIKNIFKGFSILDNESKTKQSNINFENEKSYSCENEIENKLTTPPYPYTEGELVKKMEETGIGRPSTYASTIKNIIDRGYIESGKYVEITNLGIRAVEFLRKHFPKNINVEYTSKMESKLDLIAEGKLKELDVLKDFYGVYMEEFNEILDNADKQERPMTGETCPKCGKPLHIVYSKKGSFVACSGYPDCNYIQPEYTGENCPKCGKPLVWKKGGKGKFVACSGYPNCDYHDYKKKYKSKF